MCRSIALRLAFWRLQFATESSPVALSASIFFLYRSTASDREMLSTDTACTVVGSERMKWAKRRSDWSRRGSERARAMRRRQSSVNASEVGWVVAANDCGTPGDSDMCVDG